MTKAKRRVGRPKSTAAAPQGAAEPLKSTSVPTPEPPPVPPLTTPVPAAKPLEDTTKGKATNAVTNKDPSEKNTKPWVEIIQGNRNLSKGMVVEFVAPQIIDGEEKIIIDESDVASELTYWENAVILFALGETLSMHAVKNFMEKSWNFVALPELYFNDAGYFIVRFKSYEDQTKVMEQGPYFIYVKPIFLKYWSIDFELKADLLRVLPLWITLPNLPLYLWGEKSISNITSDVGRPITTDECTARKLRISYARVLVEVDITRPIKESVTIRDHSGKEWEQQIEYEWRPKYCQTCLKIGHDCATKKTTGQPKHQQRVWQKKVPAPENKNLEEVREEAPKKDNIPSEEEWTQVASSRTDKAKKKINFTPPKDLIVQNVFTPLGIGVNLVGESSNTK
ncbi:uncharacterized protein LOC131658346 [Vicia villosa]|uniref:uncharacterized protein LOC131658346 n=1 Tax=Vicia villosa TaxID=3911 RepID=UPI00273CEFF1|nr:uncharacterized protein LOC131658346 [Vicia villosa]